MDEGNMGSIEDAAERDKARQEAIAEAKRLRQEAEAEKLRELLEGERPAEKAGEFMALAAYHCYLADGSYRAIVDDPETSSADQSQVVTALAMVTTEANLANAFSAAGELAVRIKMMELAGIEAKADLVMKLSSMEEAIFGARQKPEPSDG